MSPIIKASHITRFTARFLPMLLLIASCESACKKNANDERPQGEPKEGAAAVVNGATLSMSELDALHTRAATQFAKTGHPLAADLDRKMRGSILRKMIDDELIHQKSEKEGVKVDRFERVEAFEKYKEKMGGPEGFNYFLEHQGLTEEQVQKTVLADLQRDKLIEKLNPLENPTEEEIKGHYQANLKLYMLPEMVKARHILLKLEKNDPPEKEALVQKKAHQILKEAQESGASFESLVQKYSEGPSVKQGGDLGFFPRGRMVKTFEDLAFSAPLRTASGPIKTDFGYHIIYVEEKTSPRASPLAEVQNRIVEFIKRNKRGRKSEELLFSLRKSADVSINDYSMTQEEYEKRSEDDKLAAENHKKAD